ncbi:MAG: HEAT repeat domain-containing protein [Deltaproteobacteria bacterium]|nr:HEAT repeat domain-containing protein [Deltaproteobacteria bacterium]
MHDPIQAISRYLRAPEEPIRCAAARALGASGDEEAAPALVEALVDPDPDVRADVMVALARCARPRDAAAIRRSLQGDPVGEVKTAAVGALSRLRDEASTALLRALARDRCASDVAWEEGSWDDWLDVQVAAIAALGEMGAEAAADDLLRVRSDEAGQELDHVVFAALAKMPGRGIAALLDFLNDGDERVRQRALATLARAGRERLAPLRDRLVGDPSAGVRRLAADNLDAGDPALPEMALNDPDPSVRAAALARVVPGRPDIGRRALADTAPAVCRVALEALAGCLSPADEPDLGAKLETWLRDGDTPLAAASARVLPKVEGEDALSVLRERATDAETAVEVRIAALGSLGKIGTRDALAALRPAAADPVRQVRLAALAAAAALTHDASEDVRGQARDLLVDAVRGRLRAPESLHDEVPDQAGTGEGSGPVAITPEGGIVPVDAPAPGAAAAGSDGDVGGLSYPRSTLEAIQATETTAPSPELSPSSSRGGRARSRRVPVEGADDIDADIRLVAVRLAADCAAEGIDESLAEAAEAATPDLRAAAVEAVAQRARAMPLPPGLRAVLIRCLGCDDARVRCAAARAVTGTGHDAASRIVPLLDDTDASVRAAAVTAVAGVHREAVMRALGDPSRLVRRAAADAMAAGHDSGALEAGLRKLVDGGWSDSLTDTSRRHPEARQLLLRMVAAGEVAGQALLVILEALAGDGV